MLLPTPLQNRQKPPPKGKEDSGNAYTVNQALDALTNYYGKGYDVDGTVSEGNNYYFAVYKNKRSTPPSKSICRPAMR